MSDIAAVVLTMGEETTGRAIQSVKRQTMPPAEIILVENVTPFHKALNLGASRVRTGCFVEVDADMILDECCFQALWQCMLPGVGIVMGFLRDALVGRTCCIKMFRKECFHHVQLRDSISPDTDFAEDITRLGWSIVYALRREDDVDKRLWHTFGQHRPNYTPSYTYTKHLILGRRYRYRTDWGGLRWHLGELQRSSHSSSLLAQIAMAHGVFLKEQTDLPRPYPTGEDFRFIEGFLANEGAYDLRKVATLLVPARSPKALFRNCYRLGIDLRKHNAFPAFERGIRLLEQSGQPLVWVAKIGLCHGLFSQSYSRTQLEEDYDKLCEFLPRETLSRGLRGKLQHFARRLRDSVSALQR